MKTLYLFYSVLLIYLFVGSNSKAQNLLTTTPEVPKSHPRLFIVPEDIPNLKAKLNHADFSSTRQSVMHSNQPLMKAFKYLLYENQNDGRSSVRGALSLLDEMLADNGKIAKRRGRRYMDMITSAACVYDWCYPLLSSTEKNDFMLKFSAIHNLHSPYYPAKPEHDALSSHNAEGWFWNQLQIGLAIYDENPTVFQNASDIFFKNFQEARNWIFKSHHHHQDDYIGIRLPHALLTAFLYKKITGKDVFTSDLKYVAYQLVYGMRPDKTQIRKGDVSDDSGVYEGFNNVIGLTADYYNDPYLYSFEEIAPFRPFNQEIEDFFSKFLFRDLNYNKKNFKDLPTVKYFPEPVGGEIILRNGWDLSSKNSSDALVQMRIGNYWFGGHQGLGAFGHFSLYYKGALAIRSGMWQGSKSKAWSHHSFSYYQQTIAHNGLLVYDPSIKNTVLKSKVVKTDGGVRWPFKNELQPHNIDVVLDPNEGFKYAEEIAHEIGPNPDKPEFEIGRAHV